jgi:citrate synthase
MAQTVSIKNTGLRGITVADTAISFIDGAKGVLIYRGYRIEDLAENATFPETAYLLLNGKLPDKSEAAVFEENLLKARDLPEYIYDFLRTLPPESDPMMVLQSTVSALSTDDPDIEDESREANFRMASRLISRLPIVTAAWERIRNGKDPLKSDPELDHSANFLWLLTGEKPSQGTARELDICLILHADHTFNASTFACREVVSTRANMYAGVAAGVGALSGSLHGGANIRVMRMLLELENENDIPAWVKERIESGDRIMGMGHAVYKTMDPRATYLKNMATSLAKRRGMEKWDNLSKLIEQTALREFEKRGKTEIKPNVDFYSAPVYYMMDIPRDLFTNIFAISRVAGWCSHIIEEKFGEAQGKPALYRPQAEYVGQYCGLMGCEYPGMPK